LASAGHEVVAVFRRQREEYQDDLRRKRVDDLAAICHRAFGVSFGDDGFLALIKDSKCDFLCHHGTETADYRSPNFDVTQAVASNTHRLPAVLDSIAAIGCCKIVLTGSFFENDEGAGSRDLRAFSPYGLSKSFTWQLFRYHAGIRQMTLGKFVISNPFGPYEEPRFTHYLMKKWFAGETAAVNTPAYIRDNIQVSLLARAYADFVERLPDGISRTNPSGYVESQGAFTERVASEMRDRLGLPCKIDLRLQTEFSEPPVRLNTDRLDPATLHWNEASAWDELAAYYKQLMTGTPGK